MSEKVKQMLLRSKKKIFYALNNWDFIRLVQHKILKTENNMGTKAFQLSKSY